MTRTHAFRRGATALAASGLVALTLASPASARPDDGRMEYKGQLARPVPVGPASRPPIAVDDNAVEYFQIGAGLLAGVALAGAGAAAASRVRRSHPHPA